MADLTPSNYLTEETNITLAVALRSELRCIIYGAVAFRMNPCSTDVARVRRAYAELFGRPMFASEADYLSYEAREMAAATRK